MLPGVKKSAPFHHETKKQYFYSYSEIYEDFFGNLAP